MSSVNYCFSCPTQLPDEAAEVCPYCGFDRRSYTCREGWLRPELFANRYFVGRAVSSDRRGASFVAYDAVMRRKVIIRQLLASDDTENGAYRAYSRREEFERTYRRLASLELSSLPVVYTFQTSEQLSFAVTGYYSERTLRDLANENGAYAYAAAKELLQPVADSLRLIHEQRVFHGNVRMESINAACLPDGSNRLVLCDFSGVVTDDDPHNVTEPGAKDVRDFLFVLLSLTQSAATEDNEEELSRTIGGLSASPDEKDYIERVLIGGDKQASSAEELLKNIYGCSNISSGRIRQPAKPEAPEFIRSAADEAGVRIISSAASVVG